MDPNGRPTNPAAYAYQWQESANGGTTWTNIGGATGANFTPTNGILGIGDQGGNILRLRVTYTDNDGFAEEVFSAADRGRGRRASPGFLSSTPTFNGTAGDDIADGAQSDHHPRRRQRHAERQWR